MDHVSLLLLHLLLLFLPLASCYNSIGQFCNPDKPISDNLTSKNIDKVLAKLLQGVAPSGFTVARQGQKLSQVYGLLQCRGDVSPEECAGCSSDAVKKIRQLCPNTTDARVWFDYCFLRYDIDNFNGKLDTSYLFSIANPDNVMDPEGFTKRLGGVMKKVRAEALIPGNKALGRGQAQFSPLLTIYGLADCIRDLAANDCAKCLSIAIGRFVDCCNGVQGGQVHFSSCNARFEIYPFFYPVDPSDQKDGKRPSLNAFARNTSRLVYYPYSP